MFDPEEERKTENAIVNPSLKEIPSDGRVVDKLGKLDFNNSSTNK